MRKLLKTVNFLDFYFLLVTFLYLAWRAKVLLERMNG